MFDPKKNKSEKKNGNSINEMDFPMHYLEEDLKRMKQNPNYDPSDFSKDTVETKKQSSEKQLTQKQKTSPFLSNVASPQISKEKKENNKSIPTPTKSESKENINRKNITNKKPNDLKKMPLPRRKKNSKLAWIIIIVILFLIAGGIYFYYYKNLNIEKSELETISNQESTETEQNIDNSDSEEQVTENTDLENLEFSPKNPNFLILNGEETLNIIRNYAVKVNGLEEGSLIEFIPVDSSYENISLENFLNYLGIEIYPEIMPFTKEKEPYSIFIYKDNNGIRIGMTIGVEEEAEALAYLEEKEPVLIGSLNSLFLDNTFTENDQPFKENIYEEYNIKYKNLEEKGLLSLDYSVKNGNILLATSKNTAYAIIDKLNNEDN